MSNLKLITSLIRKRPNPKAIRPEDLRIGDQKKRVDTPVKRSLCRRIRELLEQRNVES